MRLEPFGAAYGTDPSAAWRYLLNSREPVTYDEDLGMWLIAGHDLARTVLADSRRFVPASMAPVQALHPDAAAVLARVDTATAALNDPSTHARVRAALTTVFPTSSARAEPYWGEAIRSRANELADHLDHQLVTTPWPDVDVVELFNCRYALYVLLDVLGLPADAKPEIAAWADTAGSLLWGQLDDEEQISAANGLLALSDFCTDVVTGRAAVALDWQPAGLIADLLGYRDGDDHRLTLAEIAALVFTLLLAGWESTAAALGHALEDALRDRDRWARLAVDEHYVTIHVEEALRHRPALDGVPRIATTDVDLGGTLISAGSRCLILIGTANHDPALFEQPATFDPGRARLSQHLAFGDGIRHCVGAALARLTLTIALRTLARRLPDLGLAAEFAAEYRPSTTLRMHTILPVTRTAGGCPVAHGLPAAAESR